MSESGDDEGWRWCYFRNATHPSFWVATSHPTMLAFHGGKPGQPYQKDDGAPRAGAAPVFRYRSIFDIIEMPWDWPAEVNYLEAAAFLRWKSASEAAAGGGRGFTYRFPTEAEYHAMRGSGSSSDPAATAADLLPPVVASARAVAEAEYVVAAAAGHARALRSVAGTRVVGDASAAAAPSALVAGALEADAAAARDVAPAAAPFDLGGRALLPDGSSTSDGEQESTHVEAAALVDVMMHAVAPGNINFRWHSSTPVAMYPPTAAGFHDVHGNVWQWVEVRRAYF